MSLEDELARLTEDPNAVSADIAAMQAKEKFSLAVSLEAKRLRQQWEALVVEVQKDVDALDANPDDENNNMIFLVMSSVLANAYVLDASATAKRLKDLAPQP